MVLRPGAAGTRYAWLWSEWKKGRAAGSRVHRKEQEAHVGLGRSSLPTAGVAKATLPVRGWPSSMASSQDALATKAKVRLMQGNQVHNNRFLHMIISNLNNKVYESGVCLLYKI